MTHFPRALALAWLLALVPAATASPVSGQAPSEREALRIARAWLELVDGGRYDESVAEAAPLFREMVGSGEAWGTFVRAARARYPVSGERRLVLFEPEFVPEGAPSGRYARLTLRPSETSSTSETVVLAHTGDGWRVAMYALSGG
jgi:hypothetical protein